MKQIIFALFLICLSAARLDAHAFLKRAEPSVGGTVRIAPRIVRIKFTEDIEPAFSKIQVFDSSRNEVDRKDTHIEPSDHSVLQVSLPKLGPGTYEVVWRVVSVDTHMTHGDFTFHVVR